MEAVKACLDKKKRWLCDNGPGIIAYEYGNFSNRLLNSEANMTWLYQLTPTIN